MAQVKKAAVHDAILNSANQLFTEKDYSSTTLADIARLGGVTVSNIYNYFGSKLDILYAIYEPWLHDRLDGLADEVRGIAGTRAKLRHVFLTVLRDIPSENNNFAINILQATSTRQRTESYSRSLLLRSEAKVSAIIAEILGPVRSNVIQDDLLSHLLFMAFDGFTVNYRLVGPSRRVEGIADTLCDLILGHGEPARQQAGAG